MKIASRVPDVGPARAARGGPSFTWLLCPLLLIAAPLAPTRSDAQVSAASPAQCVPRLEVIDSLLNIVSAVVEVTDGHGRGIVRLPLDYLNLIVEEIASRVQVPADVGGGVLAPMPYSVLLSRTDTMHVAAPSVRASLVFTLRPDGDVEGVGLWGSALNGALEEALLGAVLAADSARAIPPFPAGVEQRDLLLRITVEPEQFWKEQAATALTTRSELRPLFRMARPMVRITALPVRGTSTEAEEDDFRRTPARDTVRFVVSAEGAVVPSTVSVSRVSYVETGASELAWLMLIRFRPGRIGDCPVPMLVHIPMR